MKVFLTGGTGFIGQPLTKALLTRGWEVVVLVRKPDSSEAKRLAEMGASCEAGDVTNRASMATAMQGADIVIHNAGWYELGISRAARQQMHAINVTGTDHVLGLAHELGIPRVVYVSSVAYFGDSGSETRDESFRRQSPFRYYYEQSKAEAHEIALQYQQRGLPLVIICPATVVGPNDHSVIGYFLRLYLNRLMPPFAWAPDAKNASVHVNDVAEGIALAAEKGGLGETYILAGDIVRVRDMLNCWATQPGGARVRFFIPTGLAKLLFAPMAPILRMMGLSAFISSESVAAASMNLAYSSAKAQRELGWRYQPFQEMWFNIIEQERKLLAQRRKCDLVSRLRPMQVE